jgi:hypothetical protein
MVKAWLRSTLPYEGMGHGVNDDELDAVDELLTSVGR